MKNNVTRKGKGSFRQRLAALKAAAAGAFSLSHLIVGDGHARSPLQGRPRKRRGAASVAPERQAGVSRASLEPPADGSWEAEKAAQAAARRAQRRATVMAAPLPDAGEDDDVDELRGDSDVAQARSRERARVAAILTSPHAAANPALARSLALATRTTRREAIDLLAARAGAVKPVASGSDHGWARAFSRLGGGAKQQDH